MANVMKTAQAEATSVARSVESQSLNTMAAGFSFAAAIAWMDVVRAIVTRVVSTQKNGVMNAAVTALMTTLLSVVVYMVLRRVSSTVRQPGSAVFAVTA